MSAALDTATAPVANTTAGKIRGLVELGINVFKGIPYGGDTAKRRFKGPVKPDAWSGVRDCTDYGHKSPQPPESTVFGPIRDKSASEDCLVLNLWTPAMRDGAKRPVMVWLHGGGFFSFSGSSLAYDGVRQAKRGDVVTVTINHRLGVCGYTYLGQLLGEEYKDSGNAGMLDIVMALEWVRDNIAEFGGDPHNVMIYGESGGGAKVSVLMAMPSAKGLFHKAVVMSGSSLQMRPKETATKATTEYLKLLGLTPERAREIVDMPLEKLMVPVMGQTFGIGLAMSPVVDGGSLPRHPFDPDAPEISASVPMLIGTCHDETTLLSGARNPKLFELTWETLNDELAKTFPKTDPKVIVDAYRKNHPHYSPSDIYFGATCDFGMFKGAVTQAERKLSQAKAAVYMYEFDFESTRAGGKFKATHADELVYVFDTIANFLREPNAQAQRLADEMSESWIAFARSGNPNNKSVPHWPAYDTEKRATMAFNKETKIIDDPRGPERELFGQVPAARRF